MIARRFSPFLHILTHHLCIVNRKCHISSYLQTSPSCVVQNIVYMGWWPKVIITIIASENDEVYPIYLYTQPSSHENPSTKEKIDFQAELVKGT